MDLSSPEFIRNLSDFANKPLIIKSTKDKAEEQKEMLSEFYREVLSKEINGHIILCAINKKYKFEYKKTNISYKNFNRGYEAEAQTKKIKEILREKRKNK